MTKLFEHILVQTNNLCTRHCPFCYYGQKNYKKRDIVLEDKLIYRMVDQLKMLDYRGRIGFFEINEPLTDPRIFDFIKYAKLRLPDAYHMLITNGDLLNRNALLKLFRSGLDKLIISAYTKMVLGKITTLKNSMAEIFNKVEIFNYVNAKFYDNRGGNIDYEFTPIPKTPIRAKCARVHSILYVRPSGKVVSCFSDFHEVNIVGDVKRSTLKDIWFGKKFVKLRRELDKKNRRFSPLCVKCNYPGEGWYFSSKNNKLF